MTAESLLRELEGLPHSARVRRMVEVGLKAGARADFLQRRANAGAGLSPSTAIHDFAGKVAGRPAVSTLDEVRKQQAYGNRLITSSNSGREDVSPISILALRPAFGWSIEPRNKS